MKAALFDGVEVPAGPSAPGQATCLGCGGRVNLTYQERGGWYYRHARGAGADCPLRARPVAEMDKVDGRRPALIRGNPVLTLAVRIVTEAALAALDGEEAALVWLVEHPFSRATLRLVGLDPERALRHLVEQVGASGGSP